MSDRTWSRTVAILVAMAVFPPAAMDAHSQGFNLSPQSQLSGGAGVGYEVYRFGSPDAAGIRELSLLSLPWGVRSPLPGPWTVELRGAYATGSLARSAGPDISLSGLTDTELRVGVSLDRRTWVTTASAVAILPTGKATHSAEEALVAGAIAADLLPFRLVNWGTGGAIGGTVGGARPVNGGSVGMTFAYLAAREFEPLEDGSGAAEFTYRPGDQLQLRAAIDQNVGPAGKVTLSLSFQHHRADQIDGGNLYRAGNRYQALGSYAFAAGSRSSAILYAGLLHRDEGAALAAFSRDFPAQNLVMFGGGFRIPIGGGVLLPSVDSRLFLTSDGVGEGHLTGAGASLELPLAQDLMIVPNARLRYGRLLVRQGLESDITGAELGLAVRWGNSRR